MSTTQKVGQEILKVRKSMNLSQKKFGELIEKSESQVGAYENGKCTIPVDIIFKIAEVANISPEELLVGPKEIVTKTGWDAELKIYREEDRKTVMAILGQNGYDVGQHKRSASKTGKAVNYFIHATLMEDNVCTS